MGLDIIYQGTDKEKILMKQFIRPFPDFPKSGYSLDSILLGADLKKSPNGIIVPEFETQVIAKPLLINGEYVTFTGMHGRFYELTGAKKQLEALGDPQEFLRKNTSFAVEISPVKDKINYYGNNVGGVKLTTWKTDNEAAYFSLIHCNQLLQAKAFYLPKKE